MRLETGRFCGIFNQPSRLGRLSDASVQYAVLLLHEADRYHDARRGRVRLLAVVQT